MNIFESLESSRKDEEGKVEEQFCQLLKRKRLGLSLALPARRQLASETYTVY